jgi:hypothetical protein
MTAATDARPSALEVTNCYRLAHGRDPESAQVVEAKRQRPRASLLSDFFSADEFIHNVRSKVLAGEPLAGVLFQSLPDSELRSWVSRFAPLSPAGVTSVEAAVSWPRLFHALFSDPVFGDTVLNDESRGQSGLSVGARSSRRD